MSDLKENIKKLLLSLKERGYDRGKIEQELGLAENSIDQNLARGGTKKLLTSLTLLNNNILQNATSNYNASEVKNAIGNQQPNQKSESKDQSLDDLIACNKFLSRAAMIQAEADKVREEKELALVRNNSELTSLLKEKGSTAHEPGYNLLGHPYIVKKLLETLAELGTGTLWKTKEDGLILLGNRLSLPDDEEEMKGGTRDAVGKKSIVRQH